MDYSVTVTFVLDSPVVDVDDAIELLGETAAVLMTSRELSVTDCAVAEDPLAAVSLASFRMRTVAQETGIALGRLVEAEVLEWDRFEASLG